MHQINYPQFIFYLEDSIDSLSPSNELKQPLQLFLSEFRKYCITIIYLRDNEKALKKKLQSLKGSNQSSIQKQKQKIKLKLKECEEDIIQFNRDDKIKLITALKEERSKLLNMLRIEINKKYTTKQKQSLIRIIEILNSRDICLQLSVDPPSDTSFCIIS
jgi:hypothetical protein